VIKLLCLLTGLGCLVFLPASHAQPTSAWLDNDPTAIWHRSPGFYEEGGQWYAILHTGPDVSRVRLVGDFTDDASGAVELTLTPDGKFWWFKGYPTQFTRTPRAGECYRFELTRQDGVTQRIQDPAADRWRAPT
jgi:1,4-alpha-glucan branching enzyme